MKRLFLILVFFCSVGAFAGTSPAIVKIHPILHTAEKGSANKAKICTHRSRKKDDFIGLSQYEKCIQEYVFLRGIERYFKNSLEKFKSSSKKVIVQTKSGKENYELVCEINLIADELKAEKNAIYYFQFDCDLNNVDTGEIIAITEGKRKVFIKGDLLSVKTLIKEAENVIDKKFLKADELEKYIEEDIKFTNANLNYIYNDENKKYANGQEQGKLEITELKHGYLSKNGLTEFTLTAKQGKFTKDISKSIKFTDTNFKKEQKLSFGYQTYDCQDKKNADRYFETFNLQITNQLTEDKSVMVKEFKAPFECLEPYFTVTTSKKTTKTLKPIEHYRGINKDLKSYEEDKDTYYIYVDADNARIVQFHIDSKSTRKIHREAYELNMKSCKYEVKKKDKLIKNMGGSPILKSEDAGWGFEDDTKFYVNLPSSDKELSFTWGRLRKSGHYRKSIKYKEKIPKLVKEMFGKVNDMATNYRNEAKNNELIALWKAEIDAFEPSKEHRCAGKVSFESMLIPPVDGMQDPDVEFKINIRPSTKSEIKILKNRMNIK